MLSDRDVDESCDIGEKSFTNNVEDDGGIIDCIGMIAMLFSSSVVAFGGLGICNACLYILVTLGSFKHKDLPSLLLYGMVQCHQNCIAHGSIHTKMYGMVPYHTLSTISCELTYLTQE